MEVNPDEDEDILRAIVLSSLTNKHLQKTSIILDPSQLANACMSSSNASTKVVADMINVPKQEPMVVH